MDTYPTDFSLPLEMTIGTTTYGDDFDGIAQFGYMSMILDDREKKSWMIKKKDATS
jgi:hypothetical protein